MRAAACLFRPPPWWRTLLSNMLPGMTHLYADPENQDCVPAVHPFPRVLAYYNAVVSAGGDHGGDPHVRCVVSFEHGITGADRFEITTRAEEVALATWVYGIALLIEAGSYAHIEEDGENSKKKARAAKIAWEKYESACLRAVSAFSILERLVPAEGAAGYANGCAIFMRAHVATGMRALAQAMAAAILGNRSCAERADAGRYVDKETVARYKTAAIHARSGLCAIGNRDGIDMTPSDTVHLINKLNDCVSYYADIQYMVYLCAFKPEFDRAALQRMSVLIDDACVAHMREDLNAMYTARIKFSRSNLSSNPLAQGWRDITELMSDGDSASKLPKWESPPVLIKGYPWHSCVARALLAAKSGDVST